MASPAATFLNAFQTMDNSQRGWAQQQLAEAQFYQSLGRAYNSAEKERKAQDFNEMVTMLKRDDDNRQFDDQNRRLWAAQNSQNVLGAYNAETSRMNAATSRYNQQIDARRYAQEQNHNENPLGLPELESGNAGTGSDPSLPSIPSIDDPKGDLFRFGGRTYGSSWGPATASVFGGPDDPVDNGLSAFGGTTGQGGREGVAIPESVLRQTYGGRKSDWAGKPVRITLDDGRQFVQPVADLGTAEWVWERNGGPTLDLTPGAARALGGEVIYDRNGKQSGVRGINIQNVELLPDGTAQGAPEAALEFEPASSATVRLPDSAAQEPALPTPEGDAFSGLASLTDPEPEIPSPGVSFSSENLDAGISRQLSALRRDAAMWKIQEQQAANQARLYQAQVQKIRNPVNKAAYTQRAQEAQQLALEARMQAAEVQAAGQQLAKDATALSGLQEEIGKLSVIDGVLPDVDVRQIQADASNPLGVGITKARVKTLTDYDEVRKRNDLSHRSNGYVTAERVAIAGKRLEEAKDAMKNFEKFQSLTEDLAAAGDDPQKQAKIESEIRREKPGAERWQRLKSAFDQAVAADTRFDPNAQPPPQVTQVNAPAPGPPSDDWIAQADALREKGGSMSMEDQRKWSTAKNKLESFLGDRQEIINLMAKYPKRISSLEDMKTFIRVSIENKALEQAGEEAFPADGYIVPGVVGLSELPKGAATVREVAHALAEDIWTKKMGRGEAAKSIPNSPGISEKGRKLIESVSKSPS